MGGHPWGSTSTIPRLSPLRFFARWNDHYLGDAMDSLGHQDAPGPLPVRTTLGGRSSPSQCGSRKAAR